MGGREVFRCLENLENNHLAIIDRNYGRERVDDAQLFSTFDQRICHLRNQRDELRRKLRALELLEDAETNDSEDEEDGEELVAAKELLEEKKILHSLYNFVGISSCALEDDKLIMSFNTSYKDKLAETYHMEVRLLDTGKTITKHDLPCFLPLSMLEEKYMETDFQKFVMMIWDHLQAYVYRRTEVEQVKDIIQEMDVDITTTYPVDYVEMKIGNKYTCLASKFCLTYGDILQVLPTKVAIAIDLDWEDENCHLTENLNREKIATWRKLLTQRSFYEAVDMIWKELKQFVK